MDTINDIKNHETEPRGYVYLWDLEPIPLHEIPLYYPLLEKLPDHTQLPSTESEWDGEPKFFLNAEERAAVERRQAEIKRERVRKAEV